MTLVIILLTKCSLPKWPALRAFCIVVCRAFCGKHLVDLKNKDLTFRFRNERENTYLFTC